MKTAIRRSIAGVLVVSVTSLGMPSPVQAGTVTTEALANRGRVAVMLDRSDVRAALEARGVSSSDAQTRVEAMTDEEVAHIAGRMDALPAGGNPIAAIALAGAAAMQVAILIAAVIIAAVAGAARNSKKYPQQPSNDKPAGDEASPFPRQG